MGKKHRDSGWKKSKDKHGWSKDKHSDDYHDKNKHYKANAADKPWIHAGVQTPPEKDEWVHYYRAAVADDDMDDFDDYDSESDEDYESSDGDDDDEYYGAHKNDKWKKDMDDWVKGKPKYDDYHGNKKKYEEDMKKWKNDKDKWVNDKKKYYNADAPEEIRRYDSSESDDDDYESSEYYSAHSNGDKWKKDKDDWVKNKPHYD